MTFRRSLLFATLLAFAGTAHAVRMDGNLPIIPIVTHAPGVGGSVWRTDVWITNPSSTTTVSDVVLSLYPIGGGAPIPSGTSYTIGPNSTLELTDVVSSVFGQSNASGLLLARMPQENALELRARIYNVGNSAGQFGQFVPGFTWRQLWKDARITGASGVDGNRLNVGVANATEFPVDVTVFLSGPNNEPLGGQNVHLDGWQVVQVNDVFTKWGIAPAGNVQIRITNNATECQNCAIYGYASVVRNDTGDASFIFGSWPTERCQS